MTNIQSWLLSTFVCSGSLWEEETPLHSQLGFAFLLAGQDGTERDLNPLVTDTSFVFPYFFHHCEGYLGFYAGLKTLSSIWVPLQSKTRRAFHWSSTGPLTGSFLLWACPEFAMAGHFVKCWLNLCVLCLSSVCFDRAGCYQARSIQVKRVSFCTGQQRQFLKKDEQFG